jgi:hypothetical protein
MTENLNVGHGHVFKRPDGVKARCGCPGMCSECSRDLARAEQAQREQRPPNRPKEKDIEAGAVPSVRALEVPR